jgi:hypothetical protein
MHKANHSTKKKHSKKFTKTTASCKGAEMRKRIKKRERSKELIRDIMNVIKETPDISKDYWCHGDPHTSYTKDYETMETKITAILFVDEIKVSLPRS